MPQPSSFGVPEEAEEREATEGCTDSITRVVEHALPLALSYSRRRTFSPNNLNLVRCNHCLIYNLMLCFWQEEDKVRLAAMTGLDPKQINNWFINQRKRHWKPSEDMRFALMEGVAGGSSGTTLYFDTGTIGPWITHHLGWQLANSISSKTWHVKWRSARSKLTINLLGSGWSD